MGYEFDNSTQRIDYGTHFALYQSQDLSLGFWIYYLSTADDDKNLINQEDTFPVIITRSIKSVPFGFGVTFEHLLGGAQSFGVQCIPGQINSTYRLNINHWMYFACSRSFSARSYTSWFGTRANLVDAQTGSWPIGKDPLPFGTPGQTMGPWVVGHEINGAIIGPANYWDTALTRQQHLSMARCTLPVGVDPVHLLWWTKMLEGAADTGPNMFANTFAGTPLPLYVPDEGCGSFGTSLDYRLYNT